MDWGLTKMDDLDPLSWHIRETFAYYGRAMYIAQVFERGLAIALGTVYGPGPGKMTRSKLDALIESNFERTLGQLVRRLRDGTSVSHELESKLVDAVKKRNWLAHHYWWDRATAFLKEEGRNTMIRELDDIAHF